MVDRLPKYLFIVRVDVDPKDEERFNEWYNHEHIPTMLKVPGVLNAHRYISLEGNPKYTAIYEFDRPDVRKSEEWKKAAEVSPWPRNMKLSNIAYSLHQIIVPKK